MKYTMDDIWEFLQPRIKIPLEEQEIMQQEYHCAILISHVAIVPNEPLRK